MESPSASQLIHPVQRVHYSNLEPSIDGCPHPLFLLYGDSVVDLKHKKWFLHDHRVTFVCHLKTQALMLAAANAGYQFDPQDLHRGRKESAPKGSLLIST